MNPLIDNHWRALDPAPPSLPPDVAELARRLAAAGPFPRPLVQARLVVLRRVDPEQADLFSAVAQRATSYLRALWATV